MQFTTLSLLAALTALGLAQDKTWDVTVNVAQCDKDSKCAYQFIWKSIGIEGVPDFNAHCEGHTGLSDTTLRPCSIIPGLSGDGVHDALASYALLPPTKFNDQGKAQLQLKISVGNQVWQAEHHGPYGELEDGEYVDITPQRA